MGIPCGMLYIHYHNQIRAIRKTHATSTPACALGGSDRISPHQIAYRHFTATAYTIGSYHVAHPWTALLA